MSAPAHKIEIADEQSLACDHELLTKAIRQVVHDHGIDAAEISLAIVDDPTMRTLNRQYLQHDYETDVLSFVLDYDQSQAALVGQLVVSTDTAARVAAEVGNTFAAELLLYVLHGTLHLVGYLDKTPDDAADMRDAERAYLARFGFEHCWPGDESLLSEADSIRHQSPKPSNEVGS